uniref:Centrosomal protein 164 n=1 Tax=Hucho hucho TaxID=62062 RepID=A0A4W5M7U1_9TELE
MREEKAKQKGTIILVHLLDARDCEQGLVPCLAPLCLSPGPMSPNLLLSREMGWERAWLIQQGSAGIQQPLSLTLGPLQAPLGSLGSLAPLRGLDGPALRGSLSSSGGLEPLKSPLGGPLSSLGSSLLGGRQEEHVAFSPPGFEDDEDNISEDEQPSPRGSARLLQNLHLDLDALGGGLQYEDSEASGVAPPEEKTEAELQDLALSGEHSPEPPSQQQSEASEHIEVASSSTEDLKSGFGSKLSEKVLDLKDLSPANSPLLQEKVGIVKVSAEEEKERRKRAEAAERRLHAAGREDPVMEDRPPSQPSDSQQTTGSSHCEPELRPRVEGVSTSASLGVPGVQGVQRPDTSRGRLVRSPHALHKEEAPRQGEDSRRAQEEERDKERRETEREIEEEKERALRERQEKVHLLQEELRREEEEEERRLKEESEERVRSLRQRLQSKGREEESRLSVESESRLLELREMARRERENQQRNIREEGEAMLRELRATMEAEREAERERIEAQRRRDLERLREESEEKLHAEKRRLLGEREEQLSSLKQEGLSSACERRRELKSPRSPEQHLAEYQRELGDVLQEVREEVQRDHARKLGQLKDDHHRELNSIRESHLDQEAVQKEQLLCVLQEERDRLLAAHSAQLERLRTQLDSQLSKTRQTHTRKEAEIQELGDRLELRARELKSQETILKTQAANLKKRRQQLGNEEDEIDRGIEALPGVMQERDGLREDLERVEEQRDRARQEAERGREERTKAREELERMREERDKAREELERMREERDKAREESRRMKEERDRLESKVELLQERCDRLGRRVSDLEQSEIKRPSTRLDRTEEEERKKEKDSEAAPSAGREKVLHVEHLKEPPLSPISRDSESSLDDLHQYISSEGLSLQKARRFLKRESGRLRERQAALQAAQAQSSSSQYPNTTTHAQATQEMYRNLQQEASDVEELRVTVQRGNSLLRRKEERLQQLESSVAEEVSHHHYYDDQDRLAADRKVTFDVTESDMSSVSNGHDGPGEEPTVPAKVQHLAESLQHISGQLNTVLGALGSLTQRQTPYQPLPLPLPLSQPRTPTSMPLSQLSMPLSGPSWVWTPHSTSTQPRGSEDLLNSRWAKLFPGAPIESIATSSLRTNVLYSGYSPASEQARSLSSMQPKAVEMDGQRLQGLIDGNKRWLETRRKDPSVPLFTRYRTPPTMSGLVQLSLDDNNQIKVYHY